MFSLTQAYISCWRIGSGMNLPLNQELGGAWAWRMAPQSNRMTTRMTAYSPYVAVW